MRDIRAKLEKLRGRLTETVAQSEAEKAALARLEIEGRAANGKLASLTALLFRRDVLQQEVSRIESEDLPAALEREAAAERARRLATARRIHRNRLEAAAELDAAMAAAEAAWARWRSSDHAYRGELSAAGALRRAGVHGERLAQRAAWASMPTLASLIGAPREFRRFALGARDAEERLYGPDAPPEAQTQTQSDAAEDAAINA